MQPRDPSKGPDFLIIGAARAGTSWLARNLGNHPLIHMPATKELHFFDQHFDSGYDWYESQFVSERPIRGEATPAYMFCEGVAQRISSAYPRAKLVALLRNPVDRAYSHYQNLKAKYPGTMPSFAEKLRITPRLLDEGRYAERLGPFLSEFPADQIHIELFDAVQAEPQQVLMRICTFLGATDDYEFPLAQNRINSAGIKLSNARFRKLLYRVLIRGRLGGVAKRIEHTLIDSNEDLTVRERRRLYLTHFADDIEKLESILNRDLRLWIPSNEVDL